MNKLEILKTLILGIIQGFTEFLPISSSAHLVIFEKLLNEHFSSIFFEVLVHLGTLIAILVVFWKDLSKLVKSFVNWMRNGFSFRENDFEAKRDVRLVLFIILATIPTAIIGVLFKEKIEEIFHSVKLVGFMLIVTGIILIMSKINQDKAHKKIENMSPFEAILIGIVQGMAILPGISRSGSTISIGLFQKLDREFAAKFSFYLSIPAVIGACILKSLDLTKSDLSSIPVMLPGFVAAIITGILAIKILLKHISKGKFYLYSIWCFIAGLFTIIFLN